MANHDIDTSAQRSGEGCRDREDEGAEVIESVQNAGIRKLSGHQNSVSTLAAYLYHNMQGRKRLRDKNI